MRQMKTIMIFNVITTLLSITTLVDATKNYNTSPTRGGYYKKTFPRPLPLIKPSFYKDILGGFRQCVEKKCETQPREYTTTAQESLLKVGAYTACVTSCAASGMMRSTSDLKALVAKLFDIGSANLNEAHKYLAGKGDYDVLESNTRIEDSCCLPNDYFVSWSDLVFWADVKFENDASWRNLLISVKTYYEYCLEPESNDVVKAYSINCDASWVNYLRALESNVGHLVLAPKSKNLAPQGACKKELQSNPQAEIFQEAMCVAYECTMKGKIKSLESPVFKYPLPGSFDLSCPSEESETGASLMKFHRVPRHALKHYALPSGLPSSSDSCAFDFGLVEAKKGRTEMHRPPSLSEIDAAVNCPERGRFEYCNMKQYVNWLQAQLFNDAECPIGQDMPQHSTSLVCLFRIFSLKCDCMEAVLNCYEHDYKFTSELGKTIGKAASILCGFLLCQQPKIYSLLGGQSAIGRANIMSQVLMDFGVKTSAVSSFPPATFAFLSFGLGMVSVFVVTQVSKKASKSVMNDGYRNLI